VRNQRENVLMLAANMYSTLPAEAEGGEQGGPSKEDRAVKALHRHTLGAYENWAKNMHRMATKDAYGRQTEEDERGDDGFRGLSPTERTKMLVFEVVLWWCIWGEAANMRFIPEFLSWVYYWLVNERDADFVPEGRPGSALGRYEDGQGFLRKVMRPMYDFVSKEAFKKDLAGNPCDHSQKKNLDDINEFFWKRTGEAACTKYDVFEMPVLIGHLEKSKKTYVERRGLLHSVKNNLRIFTIYICLFHLIITIAHYVPFEQDALPLCPPQIPSDICRSAEDATSCDAHIGCDWSGDTQFFDRDAHPVAQCYDTCQYMDNGNNFLVERDKENCKTGCKWDKGDEDDKTSQNGQTGTCVRFSTKSSKEIMENIQQTTYINCDQITGICRYTDGKGVPVQYSCLEHLTKDERERYRALNKGEWWEFYTAGTWDDVPLIGRFTRTLDPAEDGSDMSKKRAEQIHMFDHLWEGELDDTVYPAVFNYEYKRQLLEKQDTLFTCGYDISESTPFRLDDEEAYGLRQAANHSWCCNIQLQSPDTENHGFVQVWSQSTSCRWSLWDIFTDDDIKEEDEDPDAGGDPSPAAKKRIKNMVMKYEVRMELTTTVMTLLACRLLGEMLSFISIWGSSQGTKTARLVWALWYASALGVLTVILTFGISSYDELKNQTNWQIDSPDSGEYSGDGNPDNPYVYFEFVAMVTLVPELVFDTNSAFDGLARLVKLCCPRSADECMHSLSMETVARCQPGYVRKIKGRMSSKTGPWIRYSIIWVILLGMKCYFSYVYEIRLAVKNEATTWRAIATPFQRRDAKLQGSTEHFRDKFLLDWLQGDGGVTVASIVVFLTWVPTFLVFVMDSQIAFSICQMIVGVWRGLNLRVGQVNTWPEFESRLAKKLIPRFRKNLDATTRKIAGLGSLRVSSAEDMPGSFSGNSRSLPTNMLRGTLLFGTSPSDVDAASSGLTDALASEEAEVTKIKSAFQFSRSHQSFKRFVQCWNRFMDKLRYDDYLSDREVSLYQCMKLPSIGSPWLPPLLTLDGIGNLLDRIDALEDAHKAIYSGRVGERQNAHNTRWPEDTRRFIETLKDGSADEICEALDSVKILTLFLLKTVTGQMDRRADGEFKQRGTVLNWFATLRLESCESKILSKIMKDPTTGSAKGKRDTLRDDIATFADVVAHTLCSPTRGLSKQRNLKFERAATKNQLNSDSQAQLREATEAVLNHMKDLCEGPEADDLAPGTIDKVLQESFFTDDRDIERLRNLSKNHELQSAATYLTHVLKTRRADAVVVNGEARRRMLTFASSLHMDMPKPKTVETCKSLTSFTPFFAEEVLYSKSDIMDEKDGQASMCSYLQTVHPDEWQNLVERLGIAEAAKDAGDTIPDWVWDDDGMALEVRLWASLRGQTLARTIHGVMQFEQALLLFAHQEENQDNAMAEDDATMPKPDQPRLWQDDPLWERYAHMKFQYVISCQIYGNWKPDDQKKLAVDTMMRLFPHLRIAYVKQDKDYNGDTKWFSFLVRWCDVENKVVQCYRIEQAASKGGNGNWGPTWLVGEGKPENQNHAIVFTRGQYLQTLDMNQDGYFEEALKMRNLLDEFAPAECPDEQQVRIIGFPEHQFSDTLSAVAEFSALTEFTFATLIQRSLGSPFDVRMHYGHPDIFDRVFHLTRGGISKPMKFLCVSEDIFGAFNSVLKGGQVIYREYIKQGKGKDLGFDACALFEQKISGGNGEQALSRDFSRLCEQMGITRLLSFFHSSNGFYWSNLFVIWSTSWFLYGQILISVVIPDDNADALKTVTESVVFAFQLGLVLTVPLVAELILEKGPVAAFGQMLRVVCRGG